jgi:hypothetical protein
MLEIAIFVNLRSVHSVPLPRPQLTVPAPSDSLEAARQGRRPAYFDAYQAYRDTPLYQRDLLPWKSPPYPSHSLRHYGH